MSELVPWLRRPLQTPPEHPWRLLSGAVVLQGLGALARHRRKPLVPEIDGDDDYPAWDAWHWAQGWSCCDEVLCAVGMGAAAATDGHDDTANPWQRDFDSHGFLAAKMLWAHWDFGWLRRGGRENLTGEPRGVGRA